MDSVAWRVPAYSRVLRTRNGAGRTCQSGVCRRSQCEFSESTKLSVCPGDSYRAEDTNLCEAPIPFVVSHHLLELYNGSLATALSGQGGSAKMPKLSKSMVVGFQLNTTFGKSMLGRRFTARKPNRLLAESSSSALAIKRSPSALRFHSTMCG